MAFMSILRVIRTEFMGSSSNFCTDVCDVYLHSIYAAPVQVNSAFCDKSALHLGNEN